MKHNSNRHEAKYRAVHGQEDETALFGMTREYWRASRVLRSLATERPCDKATAFRFLITLVRCEEYDRLRCAAAAALVSLGLSGSSRMTPVSGAGPAA